MTRTARLLTKLVEAYQASFAWRPSPCRYVPSCSNYALEALELHGARRGGWLAVRRISRCHPWGPHGEDPVPRPDRTASAVEPGADHRCGGRAAPEPSGGRSGPGTPEMTRPEIMAAPSLAPQPTARERKAS